LRCGRRGDKERRRSSRRPARAALRRKSSFPAMALPHRTLLLPRVRNVTPSIEGALAHASARSRLAPLVRALGLEPRNAPVPPDARGAFGLAGAEDVRGLCVIGERGGLIALVIELAGELTTEVLATTARRVRAHDPARPYLFLFAAQRYRRLAFASFGLDGELRHLVIERARPRASELEALEEMVAAEGEGGVALALRHARARARARGPAVLPRLPRAARAAVRGGGRERRGARAVARARAGPHARDPAVLPRLPRAAGGGRGGVDGRPRGREAGAGPARAAAALAADVPVLPPADGAPGGRSGLPAGAACPVAAGIR